MSRIIKEEGRVNWFDTIADNLRDSDKGELWSNGDEILCKTEDGAKAIADLLENLYMSQGDDVVVITGYYEPEYDTDDTFNRYSGWHYVTLD